VEWWHCLKLGYPIPSFCFILGLPPNKKSFLYPHHVMVYHHVHSFSQNSFSTMWGPPVISWFTFAPVTIVISTINHGYWSYVHQLSYHGGLTLYEMTWTNHHLYRLSGLGLWLAWRAWRTSRRAGMRWAWVNPGNPVHVKHKHLETMV